MAVTLIRPLLATALTLQEGFSIAKAICESYQPHYSLADFYSQLLKASYLKLARLLQGRFMIIFIS